MAGDVTLPLEVFSQHDTAGIEVTYLTVTGLDTHPAGQEHHELRAWGGVPTRLEFGIDVDHLKSADLSGIGDAQVWHAGLSPR